MSDPHPPARYDEPPSVHDTNRHLGVVQGPSRDSEFDELYRVEHVAMLRLAYLLTSDRESSAEIAHDAFMRTYERWDRLQNPGGYLRTAVVNLCNDHHRRRIRRRTRPVAQVHEHAIDDADEVLADVIAALKPKQRAAIVLRYYLDLPQAEIAEVMGVRQGTVKSLLHRALAELRGALGDAADPRPTRRPAPPQDMNPSSSNATTSEDR